MKQTTYALGVFILLAITTISGYSQNKEAMRHDFVKREKTGNDMVVGDYVILTTSTSEANAKQLTEEIQKSGYTDVKYGYLSVKKSWFIYLISGNDVEKTQALRDKYRKIERFKDAWILTVHE